MSRRICCVRGGHPVFAAPGITAVGCSGVAVAGRTGTVASRSCRMVRLVLLLLLLVVGVMVVALIRLRVVL